MRRDKIIPATHITASWILFPLILISMLPVLALAQQKSTGMKGLKDFYQNYFPIGVAVTPGQLKDSAQRNLILTHFNRRPLRLGRGRCHSEFCSEEPVEGQGT
jgi:hypothetical protein